MPIGETIHDLLRAYAEGKRIEQFGPGYREKEQLQQQAVARGQEEASMAPLRRRQAELGVESGEYNLSTARAKEEERVAAKARVKELEAAGKLPPGWSDSPEAAQWIEGEADRKTADRLHTAQASAAEAQLANLPSAAEAQRARAASTGAAEANAAESRARGKYYEQGGAAGARGPRYTGQGVHDKMLEVTFGEAKERVDASNDAPGWFTGKKMEEGSSEYNRAVAKAQIDILQERGYSDEAIAKSGLGAQAVPEQQFVRTPDGECFAVQGEATHKVDCAMVEGEGAAPADEGTQDVVQPPAPEGPGVVDSSVQGLLGMWKRLQKAAGNPRVQ